MDELRGENPTSSPGRLSLAFEDKRPGDEVGEIGRRFALQPFRPSSN